MEMVLTGRIITAQEAEHSGLVARIFPVEQLVDESIKVAETIASYSLPSVLMAKEAINTSFEMSLNSGLNYEKRLFHSLFATVILLCASY